MLHRELLPTTLVLVTVINVEAGGGHALYQDILHCELVGQLEGGGNHQEDLFIEYHAHTATSHTISSCDHC